MRFGLLVTLALLASQALAAERVWTIDRPLLDVVRSLMSDEGVTPDSLNLPDQMPQIFARLPDIAITLYARPTRAQRYYRFTIELVEPVSVPLDRGRDVTLGGLTKTLELWPDDRQDRTIVRSRLTIQPRLKPTRLACLNRLIDKIAGRLVAAEERRILAREESILRRITEGK